MKKLQIIIVFILAICTMNAQQTAFKVEIVGKGGPVLLFPGFTCTGDVWKETVAVLSKNYECHIFTFAGFGAVPAIEKPWLPKIKEQVIDYVNRLKLKKPVIIGHSLGGTLGLWLAAEQTSMFKKLIIVDALPSSGALMIPGYNADSIRYDTPYSKQLLSMDSVKFKAMAQQSASFMCLKKEKQAQLVDWVLEADRQTYVYGYIDMLKLDLRESIAKITIPVIILAATYPDKKAIERTYNTQYQKLPGKTIFYADNSAHFVMFDQPEWFLEKIKENVN
jgi:pimeloyl-ACP methyl ester carboxylesterase